MDATPLHRVFVGNLTREVTKDELADAFQASCATPIGVRVLRGARGVNFGFVTFATAEDAAAAVGAMDAADIQGQAIKVEIANDPKEKTLRPRNVEEKRPEWTTSPHRVFVGNLDAESSTEELSGLFPSSTGAFIVNNAGRKVFGFVAFANVEAAAAAAEAMDGFQLRDQVLKTEIARTRAPRNPKPEGVGESRRRRKRGGRARETEDKEPWTTSIHRVFVGHLQASTTKEDLLDAFAGATESLVLRRKGCGFVAFASADEAGAAAQNMNGAELFGRELRVELARPKEEPAQDQ
jgi:RNA recognition motif-containing protein